MRIEELFPAKTRADWRKLVEKELKGTRVDERLTLTTLEGIELDALAEPGTSAAALPSPPPGSQRRVLQEIRSPSIAHANRSLHEDYNGGCLGFLLRLDLSAPRTTSSLPPDPAQARLEMSDPSQLLEVFDGLPLGDLEIQLDPGESFAAIASGLESAYRKSGAEFSRFFGCFGADPLATLARTGISTRGIEASLQEMARLAMATTSRNPEARSIRVGTEPYHDGGATDVQELAVALATGVEYLRALHDTGLSLEAAAGQIGFSLAVDGRVFLSMAKLRGARRLWHRVLEACSVPESSRRMVLNARTSSRTFSALDPWVNVLRNTASCFAATAGTADTVTSLPHDLALGPTDEVSRRLARNTPILLWEEAHLHRVADPAGGSWALEEATHEICDHAWKLFQEIEASGGMKEALVSGWIAERIGETQHDRRRRILTGLQPILGVTEFPEFDSEGTASDRPTEAETGSPPSRPPSSEDGSGNLDATTVSFPRPMRDSEPFESLRRRADALKRNRGYRPRILLSKIGEGGPTSLSIETAEKLCTAAGFEVSRNAAEESANLEVVNLLKSETSAAILWGEEGQLTGLTEGLKTPGNPQIVGANSVACELLTFLESILCTEESQP